MGIELPPQVLALICLRVMATTVIVFHPAIRRAGQLDTSARVGDGIHKLKLHRSALLRETLHPSAARSLHQAILDLPLRDRVLWKTPHVSPGQGDWFSPELNSLTMRHCFKAKDERRAAPGAMPYRSCFQGIEASSSIEVGNDVAGNIMIVVEREHIDMVVISTHRISGGIR